MTREERRTKDCRFPASTTSVKPAEPPSTPYLRMLALWSFPSPFPKFYSPTCVLPKDQPKICGFSGSKPAPNAARCGDHNSPFPPAGQSHTSLIPKNLDYTLSHADSRGHFVPENRGSRWVQTRL